MNDESHDQEHEAPALSATEMAWMRQAHARWEHMPEGDDRSARILATFHEIAVEAERVAVRLPELTREERRDLFSEALLEAMLEAEERGEEPDLDNSPELVDRAYCLFRCWEAKAREAKDPKAAGKLAARRFMRRIQYLLEVT